MKLKWTMLLAGAAIMVSGSAFAYHSGGVAECDGCHTMHNSKEGEQMTIAARTAYTSNTYLLQGSDQSSTCLNCHSSSSQSSYKVMTYPLPAAGTAPSQFSPGGDFAWLGKTFSWVTRGTTFTEAGERHGHNIVASDFGLASDSVLTTAPGGTFNAANLSCISCHDPHGRYRVLTTGAVATTGEPIYSSGSYGTLPAVGKGAIGVYRLLGGSGYAPASSPGNPFTAAPPVAVVPSTYNRTEDTTDTRASYGQGMSEWCGNCHSGIHNDSYPGNLRHPAGNNSDLGGTIAGNYNAYVASGNLTGAQATSYTSLVPVELGTSDRATLAGLFNSTNGPDSTANVMCLSCHRAHASGFEHMMRWNMEIELLTINSTWPGSDSTDTDAANAKWAMGRTVAETQAAYYNRPASKFASYQRSLCNKCHAKD